MLDISPDKFYVHAHSQNQNNRGEMDLNDIQGGVGGTVKERGQAL